MRSFWSKGRLLNKMALTREKTVALAPMPRASAVIATAVKPGFLARVRTPKRTSCNRVSSMVSLQMVCSTRGEGRMFPSKGTGLPACRGDAESILADVTLTRGGGEDERKSEPESTETAESCHQDCGRRRAPRLKGRPTGGGLGRP